MPHCKELRQSIRSCTFDAILNVRGETTAQPHRCIIMESAQRLAALEKTYELIAALITDEEAETYPVLDHLADLLDDLRPEAAE